MAQYSYSNTGGSSRMGSPPSGADPTFPTTTPIRDVETFIDDTLTLELHSKEIIKSFGREEEYIELHIYNTSGQRIYSEPNFTEYTKQNLTETGLATSLNINPTEVLSNRGYITGQYILYFHVLRNKIFNSSYFPFIVKEISNSRQEIKSISEDTANELFDREIENFILEIESSAYFKEFSLNYGEGKIYPAINLILNTDPFKHELFLKTLDPLPASIDVDNKFKIVEEIADPITFSVDLGDPEIESDSIELMGPNFQVGEDYHNPASTDFKTYDKILEYSVSSSYDRLLNRLENPDIINIQYDFIRNVSSSTESTDIPYHFDNFVHFSSAIERLETFKYKLKQIELYDSQLTNVGLISGSITGSSTYTDIKNNINKKRQDLIKGFNGYEYFLYYNSGSLYSWPKSNATPPYNLYSISSSEANTWIGSADGASNNYGGQLLSASLFDKFNENNLKKLIPSHISDNPDNEIYVKFIDMIGQQFDQIWTHIKHITEIHNADNKFGISKDLVYLQLKSLGIDALDQFENANLIEYILGEGLYDNTIGNATVGNYIVGGLGNNYYNISPGTTAFITASNDGSIPKGNITREIWKRLYNNAPLLLKTKGTERGLYSLMNCYGIPRTILNVKEYGGNTHMSGPLKDLDLSSTYKTFSYEKSGLTLKGESGTTGYFISTKWSSSATDALSSSAKTVEFRIKPTRISTDQHLFTLSGSDGSKNPNLIIANYPFDYDVSSSNDSTQHGRLELIINDTRVAETEYFPLFNGDFWNVFIGVSGSQGASADIKFGAYQSNWLKHVSSYTSSISQTEADRQLTFGDPYYLSTNKGGALHAYFGGMPTNTHAAYGDTGHNVDVLRYSGSLQEIRYYFGELLSHETLKKHALDPFMYSGNTPSSSFEHLVLRLPLGSNDKKESGSFHPNIDVNYLENGGVGGSLIENGFVVGFYKRKTSSSLVTDSQEWKEEIETHHLPTPDTVGSSMTSEKIRIDNNSISSDNILKLTKRKEKSTLDNQPPDYEDLGVYFSPTNEINEDILYTLGSFRLDDYLGNPLPSAQTSSIYEDLKDIQKIYNKKIKGRYNYWDYIKIIQNFDPTLFKLVEQFVPFKSNLKKGLLIEPTYLERNKLPRNSFPNRSDGQTMTTGSHQTFEAQLKTKYTDNKIYKFAPTSLYDMDDLPLSSSQTFEEANYEDWYLSASSFSPTSSNVPTTKGQWEPGTYVVSYNNLTNATSSKTSERLEQGLNTTIELYSDYMDPVRNLKNEFRTLHSFNGQSCQAPIKPFVQRLSNLNYGLGVAQIGSNFGVGLSGIENGFIVEEYTPPGGFNGSFIIGEYSNNAGGNFVGVGFSAVEGGFAVEAYTPQGETSIGTATIGSTFAVGTYTNLPTIDPEYRTHKSSVLLGNATIGRKSKKYFKYSAYAKRYPGSYASSSIQT